VHVKSTRIPLDRLTWVRWRRAVLNVLRSEVGGRMKLLFGALIALLLAINGLNVVNSYVGRDFMTALENRDHSRFLREALRYVVVFAASTVAAVLASYTQELLGLLWRNWLTRRLVGIYLTDRSYVRLQAPGGLPNPDQRISEDIRTFVKKLKPPLKLSLPAINSTRSLKLGPW
jgi:putative ATP-binding cassette transporter